MLLLLFQDKTRRIPLNLYRAKRLRSTNQHMVLGVMGRGCSHPRCAVTAAHCAALVCALALPASGPLRSPHIHHIREQRNGGWTNIDNLTLVCDYHHHLIDQGWKVERVNGQIHWTAPGETRSQTNTHHRPQQAAA